MKLALLADTHYGGRNDHPLFVDNMKKFLNEAFFPRLAEGDIDVVVHLGDLLDRRKYVNFVTAHRLHNDFLLPLNNTGIPSHIIAGNHDEYFKDSHHVNSLDALVSLRYPNIRVHTLPATVGSGSDAALILPWITDSNRAATVRAISETKASVCIGHFDLTGHQMYRGVVQEHGHHDDIDLSRFEHVFSGHFHTKSTRGNVTYVGAAGEYIWSDYDDPRGFSVWDTERRSLDFIRNPFPMFKKVHYDDSAPLAFVEDLAPENYRDKFVKVIVANKTDPYKFDKMIDALEACAPADVLVVEDHLNLDDVPDAEIISEAQDTATIFRNYIRGLDAPKSDKLERVVMDLYQEALTLE